MSTLHVVVLGCKPSKALWARVDAGVALHRELRAPLVMTGRGESGPMADHAGLRGVLLEDRATTTAENASCCRELLGDVPVLVVTQWWHLPRALRHFRRHFSDVRPHPVWKAHKGAIREVGAWAVHLTWRP